MLDIKITSNGQKEFAVLAVDDVEIEEGVGHIIGSQNEMFWASIYDYEISRRASEISFLDIPKHIARLSLYLPVEFCRLVDKIEIRRQEEEDNFEIVFEFEFDFENWKQPWSIIEFAEAMTFITEKYYRDVTWVQEDEVVSNGCCIVFQVEDVKSTIWDEYCRLLPKLKEIYDKAIVLLLARSKKNSMVMLFDFPEQVRVPCEQYLLYFSEFLREVGIDSTASIQHEMGKVLFSIVPESMEAALERINEALKIFLGLPIMIHEGNVWQGHMDIPQQQLMANIHFLHGQLTLAKAAVQAQENTIRNQQIIIDQQNNFNERILHESLHYITDGKKVEDKETFLKGMLAVKKTEVKGVEIDIPRIYRWVKDKLGF